MAKSGYVKLPSTTLNPARGVQFQKVEATQPENIIQVRDVGLSGSVWLRVNKDGYLLIDKTSAPADGDISTSEFGLWLDTTAGAPKVMAKVKDSAGTVFSQDLSSGGSSGGADADAQLLAWLGM